MSDNGEVSARLGERTHQTQALNRAREGYESKLRAVHRFQPDVTPPQGIDNQPVARIRWVDPKEIRPNYYNPNFTPGPELKLLKVSILSDGWTMPVVVSELPEGERVNGIMYEVTDGEHRWLLTTDPDILAMTDGLVPISVLHPSDDSARMMSTVRHNRARGSHHVLGMADIVATLVGNGLSNERISVLLGMEEEEIDRMLDRGDMLKRGSAEDFGRGWVPR